MASATSIGDPPFARIRAARILSDRVLAVVSEGPPVTGPRTKGPRMATTDVDRPNGPESGWAIGGIVFAATIMILIGVFQIIAGLVAIIDDDFFVVGPNYTYDIDTTGWGVIHLIIGIVVLLGGFGLLARKLWAAVLAIGLAMISAIANFFFIPYYPFWSLLMIALAVFVIWSITRPGAIADA
jgi:hypothetical protein